MLLIQPNVKITILGFGWFHIDRLVQERRNSSALAMELPLSCTIGHRHVNAIFI